MGARRKLTVDQVADALRQSGAVYTEAARLLSEAGRPCCRQTVANYVERHPELRAVEAQTREALLDLAEGNIVRGINAGDATSTIFYLKTKGKHRGYTQRIEHTGQDGAPIATRADLSSLTTAELKLLLAAANKLREAGANGSE